MAASTKPDSDVLYSERLYVAWWGCLLPLIAGVLLAAAVANALRPAFQWIPFVVAVALAVWVLVMMSRTTVAVHTGDDGRMLQVGKARLPLRWIGEIEVVPTPRKRVTMGPLLDPMAYVQHRPWIGPMLKITLTDPDDETPYWLFSTRKPERLAEVLRQA